MAEEEANEVLVFQIGLNEARPVAALIAEASMQAAEVTQGTRKSEMLRKCMGNVQPTICDWEPSVLLFDFEVTQALRLCSFLFPFHTSLRVVA